MELLFFMLAISSFSYFVILLLHCGMIGFLWFWPFFSLLNLLTALFWRWEKRQREKNRERGKRVFVFFMTSYALSFVSFLLLSLLLLLPRKKPEAGLDYVIVMGTYLSHNKASDTLKDRLEKAADYAGSSPGTVFILSGGRGKFGTSTQASVMYYYMIKRGVPASKLLMEFYSSSLQEKIGYSVQTILSNESERAEQKQQYILFEDGSRMDLSKPNSVETQPDGGLYFSPDAGGDTEELIEVNPEGRESESGDEKGESGEETVSPSEQAESILAEQEDRERKKESEEAAELSPAQSEGREEAPSRAQSALRVGIICSRSQFLRAERFAKRYGLSSLELIPAQTEELLIPHTLVREVAEFFKDRLIGNI